MDEANKVKQTMTNKCLKIVVRGSGTKGRQIMRWMVSIGHDMNKYGIGGKSRPREDGDGWYRTPTWHPSWTSEKKKSILCFKKCTGIIYFKGNIHL